MFQSNFAFYSNHDLPHKMRELENNWELFMTENQIIETVRPVVYESWKRCQKYDVNPLQKQTPEIIDKENLMELISSSNLYETSHPVIEELYNQIKGTQHLITLSDNNGRIIYVKGDYKIESQAEKMNFIAGANWSEEIAGSNAIGTSLAAGKPVQILSHEHFCEGVHPWVCSASPIRDPLTKKILGIIDLTGPSTSAQSHSLTVVQSVSGIIEHRLLKNANIRLNHLQEKFNDLKRKTSSAKIVVCDEALNIVRGDSDCLPLLQIMHWDQLWLKEETKPLKSKLLHDDSQIYEWEWEIPSLNVKIFIQNVILESECIGFVFCFEKMYNINSSAFNSEITLKGVIGQSDAMKKSIHKAQVIANTNVPVLLTGQSGTGKEVFAYAIHQQSERRKEPFIAINCGAIPANLISSELFGYEPGAFTGGNPEGKIGKFEEANNGTILLDEIGEMPLDLQVHLLRVLQEKEIVRIGASKPIPINVRIIAATNKHLPQLIHEKLFREDLYFRLNVVELHLPPLKERKGDIQLLSEYFANELSITHQKHLPTIDKKVLDLFHTYHWPGNIRELMNVMEYAVLFCDDNHISLQSLPTSLLKYHTSDLQNKEDQFSPLENREKEKIKQLLIETNGNLSEVARRCKIARTTLYRKIDKYNLHNL